mgnify:CR=1 FL=1
MSDDLVKRLRERAYKPIACTPFNILMESAERIEELEAKLAKAVEALELADQAIMEVVNGLDLAGVASAFAHIRTIRTTLAELKGEK